MKTRKEKQGISLIVLVITIIVMIILAAAIVTSLSNSGIISKANEAVDATDKKQIETLAQMLWAEAYLDGKTGAEIENSVISGLEANGISTEDYIITANGAGVEIQDFNKNDWEFAYTYSNDAWSDQLTPDEFSGNIEEGIVVKFYKTGQTITPPGFTFNEEEFTFTAGESYRMIIQGNGNMGVLMTTSGTTITGANAWQYDTALFVAKYSDTCIIPYVTEVIIEDGVENIGAYAFCGASSLKRITYGKNIRTIEQYAFMYCVSLTSVAIPNGINYIGNAAFIGCDSLISVTVGTKEEWNNVLIGKDNYDLLDATVSYKYRTKVERLANEGWQKAYDSGKKTQSALETAVTEYLTANNVSTETLALYNIAVTTTGVNITGKETTLGDVILSAADYGKTINYTANGISDWKVLYKQTIEDETTGESEEYVYLIASENAPGSSLPTNIEGTTISGNNIYWLTEPSKVSSGTINNTHWLANWSDYSTNANGRCVTYFLDEAYWTAFKNTSKYGDNVVGAIGTPTAEMIVASYNARSIAIGDTENSTLTLTNGEYGYEINEAYSTSFSRLDKLYTPNYKSKEHTWLASPSGYNDYYLLCASNVVGVGWCHYSATNYGARPVVSLKFSIPAYVGVTADSTDIILK